MDQMGLFGKTSRPIQKPTESLPHNGTATSRAAAVVAKQGRKGNSDCVVAYLKKHEPFGATREAIARNTGIKEATVCSVVNRLVERGVLMEAGERKTSTGCMAKVVRVNAAKVNMRKDAS